ncbi:hypothetical protein [Roseiarcus sp.]|uniref:hypothetical protein n=1 Tax=Roseiarcus sp. TaxID=1969460 RepID=UPI003F9D8F15
MFKVTTSNRDLRARQSLRLDPETWEAIDAVRLRRAGSISRNTWITEAILEKLERDQSARALRQRVGGARV